MKETSESIDSRLVAAQDSQKRSHLTIVISSTISLMILTASYNAYLSFNRTFAVEAGRIFEKIDGTWVIKEKELPGRDTTAGVLTRRALDEFVSSRMVTISLIGTKIDVDDAPQLGGICLFIVSIWVLLAVRRENYTIGFLLRDCMSSDPKVTMEQWRVFHGIESYSLFTTASPSLEPIRTLLNANPTRTVVRREWLFFKITNLSICFFPAICILIVYILGVGSLFLHSPFRPDAAAPWLMLQNKHEHLIRMFVIFMLFEVPLAIVCYRVYEYRNATEELLRQFFQVIKTKYDNLP